MARPRSSAQRFKARIRRCHARPATPSRQALAFQHYLCLLLEEGTVVQLQLTLSLDLPEAALISLLALFRYARVMAFLVDKTTLLVAAGVPMTCAFADRAGELNVLGRKLKACLKQDFGTETMQLSQAEQERMAYLNRALSAVARVDVPAPGAFAGAGFDLSKICSSPRCR